MNIPIFLACIYLFITVILVLKRKRFGNMFLFYGGFTFLYVIAYPTIISVPKSFRGIMLIITFSIMILLFGLTFAVILKLLKKSDKASRNASIIASLILILLYFNMRDYFTFLWIPVLLYKLTDFLNRKWVVADN